MKSKVKYMQLGPCACNIQDSPSVSASLSSYPLCPAASSLSTGQRSMMDLYKTSDPPSHHPCRWTTIHYILVGMSLRS